MTKKRRPWPIAKGSAGIELVLRHTVGFGPRSGYEAPVNSYLTGASPIYLVRRSRRALEAESFVALAKQHIQLHDDPSLPRRVSLVDPHSSAARPPMLAPHGPRFARA